jgi:predicted permease
LLASVASLASSYLIYRLPTILLHWLVNPRGEIGGVWWSLAPDWYVFAYLTLVTVLAGTMAGLTPALLSLKVNLSEVLKGYPGLPGAAKGSWVFGLLIGTQVALSFFLLYGAGFCLRTFQNIAAFEPGFETRQLLWARVAVRGNAVAVRGNANELRAWSDYHRTLTERLTALPGVQSVAYSVFAPFNDWENIDVQASGQALRGAATNWVSSNYFTTLGIPIVSGRKIQENDPPCVKSKCSVVVSQRFAREFWPNENPLGKMLREFHGNLFEVVGVARDVSSTKIGGPDAPMIYQPLNASAFPANPSVRFSGDGAAIARAVTVAIRGMSPDLSVRAETFQSLKDHEIESIGKMTQLIVFLCAIAVILAVIGIYGVVAFAVTQRTKEMGIRIALGAKKKDIYRVILMTSGRPVAVGLLIGLAFTVATFSAMGPLLRSTSITVNIQDSLAYAISAILLVAAALAALLVPARRATRVDPMAALREE